MAAYRHSLRQLAANLLDFKIAGFMLWLK